MAVNLKKNQEQLLSAFKEVLSDSNSTTWVVFGYEGKTYDLKVVEKGDGDLEELVDEMSSGKVLYAMIRMKDPNTQLLKNVWINWSGEGVPSSVKGVCANHVPTVSRFFKGAHVTINARSEEDLDEDTILDKISKSSGSNYSIHKEKAKTYAPQGTVGSVYKKTDAQSEIRSGQKDAFWTKQERDEEERRRREADDQKRRRVEEEQERKQRDIQAAKQRERAADDRFKSIQQQKQREQEEERSRRQEREAAERSRMEQVVGEIDADKRREEREAEARRTQEKSSIGSAVRDRSAGDVFKGRGSAPEPPVSSRQQPETYQDEPEPEPEPEPYEPEPEPYQPEPEPEPYQPEPEPEPYQPEPEPEPYQQEPEQQEPYYEQDQSGYEQQDYPGEEQQAGTEEGTGFSARAVYDYQAGGEDEISFDPDEIITNIEKIDDGWWMGTNPRGETGLFPSNYVEEI